MTLREQLRTWFSTGKYPTQQHFSEVFDSFYHKEEDAIPSENVDGLQDLLDEKISKRDTGNESVLLIEDVDGLQEALNEATGNVVFYEYTTGALTANVVKACVHSKNLAGYIINIRDADNNVGVSILKKTAGNEANSVDVKVEENVDAPGLIIQIIGV